MCKGTLDAQIFMNWMTFFSDIDLIFMQIIKVWQSHFVMEWFIVLL